MRASRSRSEESEQALPRAFNVFWVGQGLSAVGDAMTVVAMPLVVLAASGSVADMGRLTAFARAGGLIAVGAAGFFVDRFGPRGVMLACDIFRCALLALIPVAATFEPPRIGPVYLVGIGAALAQGIFYVGHVSLIAALVGRARVSLANSRVEGTIAVAYVVGPLVAGLLSARMGPASVLALDSLTFLASAISLYLVGSIATTRRESTPASSSPAIASLIGLRFIRQQPLLVRLTGLVAICQFFTAAIVDLFVFRLKRDLGQDDTGTGMMFALAAAASVGAAAVTPWLRVNFSFQRIWVVALLLQGLAAALSFRSQSFAVVAGAAALYMAAMTVLLICQASIRQELTPQHLLGRVTSSYLLLVSLPAPIGALAATALAARHGAAPVQAGIGAGLLLTAALATWVWVRMPETEAR